MTRRLDALVPRGFRAPALIAPLLVATGIAQAVTLFFRAEPYPFAAAVLAMLLAGGGAVLAAFIAFNARWPQARDLDVAGSTADLLPLLAAILVAVTTLWLWRDSGTFFPLRMALAWRDALPFDRLSEPALPMMLAGTCLLALGAAATALLAGGLWLLLYARGMDGEARAIGVVLSFAGAVPYVGFALVIRALLCTPVALLAAGQWLAVRPDDQLAYSSLLGIAPGLLSASVGLGFGLCRGLWSWLDDVRRTEESSDSFLAARVRGQPRWEIVLRNGVWLRRRRELGALLLSGMAAAVLIDVLSNTLIDSFRPPGFPPYPSLGAALFLRGVGENGVPAALPQAWRGAHFAIVAASVLLLVGQTLPRAAVRIALEGGILRVGRNLLASAVPSAHGLSPRPALQWVLGPSGAGKSTLLRAWAAQLPDAVLVPQDPDEALPASFSALDVARVSRPARGGERVLWDVLGRLGDAPVQRRLLDPFTPVSTLSRGERQRLLVAAALSRARSDPGCTLILDEPTAAQDVPRTHALLGCLRELLTAPSSGTGAVVVTAHDPEPIDALLGDRGAEGISDHVVWIDGRRASSLSMRRDPERRWEGTAPRALQDYLDSVEALFAARGQPGSPGRSNAPGGLRPLRSRVMIGGRSHAVSPEARLREGELVILSGPSGSGKSTVLREIAGRPPLSAQVGYVMQDAARAFPAEMPVGEVLDGRGRDDERNVARAWFGAGLDGELAARSVGALSEGERQRIVLAAEVTRLARSRDRTRLLLLDEPFGAVDPGAHLRLMEILLRWVADPEGRNAAILVSHSPMVDLGLAHASGVPAREWTLGGTES
jgi:ABC-type multidrug transport system ATPase subunit